MSNSTFNRLRPQGGGGVPLGLSYTSLLNVAYINLNCLSNKVSYVDNLLKSNNINILGVGETWLVSSVTDSFVEIPDYKLIRRDDPSNIRKHGVAMYVKDNLKYVEVPCNMKNVVIIKLVDQDIFILSVYRPPGSSYSNGENTLLVNTLREFCSDKEVIILGD